MIMCLTKNSEHTADKKGRINRRDNKAGAKKKNA